jgi:hypothetical protein
MPDWLEVELARRLTPVAAPEALWERVEAGRPTRRRPSAQCDFTRESSGAAPQVGMPSGHGRLGPALAMDSDVCECAEAGRGVGRDGNALRDLPQGLLIGVRRISLWTAWPVAAMATLAVVAGALWLAEVRDPALDIRQLAASEWWRSAPLELQTQDPGEIRRWLRQQAGLDVPIPPATTVRLEGARVVRRGAQGVAEVKYRVGKDTVTLLVARADPGHPLPPHGGRAQAWQARDQVYAVAVSNPDRAEAACLLCHATL